MRSCFNIKTGELCFVKIYRKHELSAALKSNVEREIRYFREFDHPNILKCKEVIEEPEKLFVIFDQVKGQSLYMHVMEHGELTEAETAVVAAQIVSLLRYLHKRHILVRNLCPSQLVCAEGQSVHDVKLVDLLFATVQSKATNDKDNMFTVYDH